METEKAAPAGAGWCIYVLTPILPRTRSSAPMVKLTPPIPRPNKKLWSERLKRLLRYRLVIPLKRSRHPPEYTARAVAVGLFWGLTPTVLFQVAVTVVYWWISRRFLRRDFSLIIALCWTWVSNMFTVLPLYYLFYITGHFILGWENASGYSGFVELWRSTVAGAGITGVPSWDLVQAWGAFIFKDWFAAMAVGCLPYAIIAAWLGWRWSLALVKAYREARQRRAERREHAALEQAGRDPMPRVRDARAPAKPRRTGPEGANYG